MSISTFKQTNALLLALVLGIAFMSSAMSIAIPAVMIGGAGVAVGIGLSLLGEVSIQSKDKRESAVKTLDAFCDYRLGRTAHVPPADVAVQTNEVDSGRYV